MASEVYFKFKSSVKTDSIRFDGSAISVKELKDAIKNKCCLRSADLDLKLEDNSGKEYTKDTELIPKFTSIVVRRIPKPSGDFQRRKVAQSPNQRDKCVNQGFSSHTNISNLADSDLTEEEKIKLMIGRSSEVYSSKNYAVKPKACGIPPPTYVCHKCNQGGHWIHDCPGIKDVRGNLVDSKTVKRPTGIPQDFLMKVDPGTPGAYLDKCGHYMIPKKDAEAYAQKKKEKRAFSVEENPPYVPPQERMPSAGLVCPLCKKLLKDAVIITCCGTSYCNECITNHCFVLGSKKCPNCGSPTEKYDSAIIENAAVRQAVLDWSRSGNSLEVTNHVAQPEVVLTNSTSEPEKVVRRLLKPKQSTTTNPIFINKGSAKQESISETRKPTEEADSKKDTQLSTKQELSCESVGSETLSIPPKSESPKSFVKSTPIESHPSPVVANTSNVVNLPCANSFGVANAASVLPTLPVVTSLYNGAPLVFPGEGASITDAVYSGSLAATLAPVGASQASLNTVFPSNSLVPSGSLWPPVDLSLLGGVEQGGFLNSSSVFSAANPLVGFQSAVNGEKLLSEEEFYRMKRQLLKSHRGEYRRRRSRSRSSPHSRRRGDSHRRIPMDRYSRRREDDRTWHRRSPRRRCSPGSGSEQRSTRADGKAVDDYDTWRRKKERRLRMETVAGGRSSPFHDPRSASPSVSPLISVRPDSSPRECSGERSRRNVELDRSRLRSPFHEGTPTRKSLDENSPGSSGKSRHQDRRYQVEDWEYLRKLSVSKESSIVPDVSSLLENIADLDPRALKKLRKQQKKKAKKEKKLARRAARARRAAAASAGERSLNEINGVSSLAMPEIDCNDVEISKSKRNKKREKRKHKHERAEGPDSESGSRSKRKRRTYSSSDEEQDELVEVC